MKKTKTITQSLIQWLLLIVHKFQSLSQSHFFIRNDSHQIIQCEYKFENTNCDAGNTYGMNRKK